MAMQGMACLHLIDPRNAHELQVPLQRANNHIPKLSGMLLQDTEENKLVYMELFQSYCELLENIINQHLTAAIPSFNMDWFLEQLEKRESELDAEVGYIIF
jgi:hypothetical protein